MTPNPKEISASQFKARCLALLDEVEQTGVPYVVTKRGRPIARLVALESAPVASLLGSVSWSHDDDLVGPVGEPWDADG